MCAAHILSMLGFATFAALLPNYAAAWNMTNTEAGWIGSAYLLGYTLTVPLLVTLTDRVSSLHIYVFSAIVTAIGHAGFALWAGDVWSAALFRALAGIGLSGTYMPGLTALAERVSPLRQSRVTALYTSCFMVGAAISYPFSTVIASMYGEAASFWAAAAAVLLAMCFAVPILMSSPRLEAPPPKRPLFAFAPVLRNRNAMAYTLCYAIHSWEFYGFQAWVVAFLTFAAASSENVMGLWAPAVIASAVTLIGMPTMIAGNEFAIRSGRTRAIAIVMVVSALFAMMLGAAGMVSYTVAAIGCLIYGVTTMGESAVVTAGALGSAAPGQRGATMAVHSTLGFFGAMCAPLAFGMVLDAAGGNTHFAWWAAFAHMGLVMLLGPVVLWWLKPTPLPGER